MAFLTVSARLNRCLNVANALDSYAVLVVAVDELVLELTNLVDEHTELVGDIGNIIVAALAPDRELLLFMLLAFRFSRPSELRYTYCDLHALTAHELHGAHDVLLHLDKRGKLLCEIRTECARVDRLAECVAFA